jgi:hypothetical protein
LRFANREQDFTEQKKILRHLGDQISIDGIEQANTCERFDSAKCGVVDVDDPNTTVAVNELLHGIPFLTFAQQVKFVGEDKRRRGEAGWKLLI